MSFKVVVLSFCALLMVVITQVDAQLCDPTDVASQIERYAEQMKDKPYPISQFDDLSSMILSYQAFCAEDQDLSAPLPEPGFGLAFSLEGEASDEEQVLGDLEIPDGFYKVQVVTHGLIRFEFQMSMSQCYKVPIPYFFAYPGNAAKKMEILFVAKSCRDELSIVAQSDWRLDFYPLSVFDFETLKEGYSSETEGLSPVIGPVKIPDGQYLVTLVSEDNVLAHFERISGTCDLWHDEFDHQFFPRIDNALPKVETLLTAQDCTGFLAFASAQSPWTLTFELLK